MIRMMKFSRVLPGYRRFLHTFKSQELDEPAYHKKPLDPKILSLVKKYDSHILYSSHIELNKKSLTYKKRMELMKELYSRDLNDRLNQAIESEPSIIVEKLSNISELKYKHETKQNIVNDESIIIPTKTPTPEYNFEQMLLTKQKLNILSEMGLRRSAIEHEIQAFPDNWMEDYETFDENDIMPDYQYGTPGEKKNN